MKISINGTTLELTPGDIRDQDVDAIVNAANSRLAGGGGVDGAIHRRGGPAIMDETNRRYPDGCPTGSAVISGAGDLPCKYVLHAVGPFYDDGRHGEPEQLAAAYRKSLELAIEHDCDSIAMPALSTGAYRYPMADAARVALQTTSDFLKRHGRPSLVRFVLFGEEAYTAFEETLKRLPNASGQ